MNRLFAWMSDRSASFQRMISANLLIVIQDGQIQADNLKKAYVSQCEAIASLRSNAHLSDPSLVQVARLEGSGQISVIPKISEPQVLEMKVEEGVQTVCIKLEP